MRIPSFDKPTKENQPKALVPATKKRVPLTKLLILANSRQVDLRSLLEYELSAIPYSLFIENGVMRKTTKSQLISEVEKHFTDSGSLVNTEAEKRCLVIDGMSLVQINKPTKTFSDYANVLWQKVMMMADGYSRVDVVFDVYNSCSIKSAERNRRSTQKMSHIKILNDSVPIPKDWMASKATWRTRMN